ncbi:hypothetical protein FQA39_LY09713 [Lamprigera yunnana]|nr:hypothetical protein FQA39_LY09713 [Lamprigera yunnana]
MKRCEKRLQRNCFPLRPTLNTTKYTNTSNKHETGDKKWINIQHFVESSTSQMQPTNEIQIKESNNDIDLENELTEKLSPTVEKRKFRRMSPIFGSKICPVSKQKEKTTEIEVSLTFDSDKFEIETELRLQTPNLIGEFLSQECLEITCNTDDSNTASTSGEIHYQVFRKCKKGYKENGLAHNIQAALLQQSANVSFWKHELEFYPNLNRWNEDTACFKIINVQKQLGLNVLECENLENGTVQEELVHGQTEQGHLPDLLLQEFLQQYVIVQPLYVMQPMLPLIATNMNNQCVATYMNVMMCFHFSKSSCFLCSVSFLKRRMKLFYGSL